jgi:hypothetical protein
MGRPRLPPLNAIKAFEAAARLGSFTRAAEELNVTHGAVSRQIRLLETEARHAAQLGLALLRAAGDGAGLRREFLSPCYTTSWDGLLRV